MTCNIYKVNTLLLPLFLRNRYYQSHPAHIHNFSRMCIARIHILQLDSDIFNILYYIATSKSILISKQNLPSYNVSSAELSNFSLKISNPEIPEV